jgi:hypothetical protein
MIIYVYERESSLQPRMAGGFASINYCTYTNENTKLLNNIVARRPRARQRPLNKQLYNSRC